MLFDGRIDDYLAARRGAGDAGRRTQILVPRIQVVTPPSGYAVTLEEQKLFLKIDGNDEDAPLTGLIATATAMCETYTGRAFITRTLKAWYDAAPAGVLRMPYAPVTAFEEITYYGDDDIEQVMDAATYQADIYGEPARIIVKNGSSWPVGLRSANALAVEFACGYGAAAAVPEGIKLAIKTLVVQLFESRDTMQMQDIYTSVAGMPAGVKAALSPFLVPRYED